MIHPLRTSIAVRSATVLLLIVGVVGLAFFALTYRLTERQAEDEEHTRLVELLDTVERTASVACFLADKALADEVARGLMMNRTVRTVTITAGGNLLAHRGDSIETLLEPDKALGLTLVRAIKSPFSPAETVGEVVLVPNAAEIRGRVVEAAWLTGRLLLLQVVFTGFGVVLIVVTFITRPIAAISARLHEMRPEIGQKLEVPRGNRSDEIGQLVHDVNSLVDYLVNILKEERHLHAQLGIEERKFRAIFEHAQTGIFLLDTSGQLVSFNRACGKFFGFPAAAAGDVALPAFVDLVNEHWKEAPALIARAVAERRAVDQDVKVAARPGIASRWLNVVLTPVEDSRLQGVVNDITELKRSEEAALALAATDPLTGLPNRLGFDRRLEKMIDDCHADARQRFTLLMVDLDWFKQINDNHGHQAGDLVLVCTARALEKAVRKTDFVARVGGDEFVLLLGATHEHAAIEAVIRKVIAGAGQPISISPGVSATIGASVGAAVFEGGAMTCAQLLKDADEAMYQAKAAGRNGFRFARSSGG
ncbi:MAG: sensor domain-containing diguanylate cyclase [Usitatibacter sp.]